MITRRSRFNRRTWLKGLGASAALTPFVPLPESRAAEGAPLRLLLLFTGNGVVRDRFTPSGTEDDWSLSETLEPLAAVKEHVVVFDGFKYNKGGAFHGHPAGPSSFAAGCGLASGGPFYDGTVGWGLGQTIDQKYADSLPGLPFHSLQLRAGYAYHPTIWNVLSYAGTEQPLGGEYDPTKLFDYLFSDAVGGVAELEALRARRKSVLDVVLEDAERLAPRVSGSDRQRLEAHLQLVRELEVRLDQTGCDPSGPQPPDEDADYWSSFGAMPSQCDAMRDLITAAFACDLTRSISLVFGGGATSQQEYPWLDLVPMGGDTTHHDMSHETFDVARDNIVEIDRWHFGVIAQIIEDLAATPDVDGNSVLHNTLIMWGTDIGEGPSHTWGWIPAMFAGQAGGRLRTDRFVRVDEVPFNRALVSVLHELGFPEVDSFGTNDNGSGGLDGIFG